ncbi:MAG: amino acid ABC transporter permease [Deltaproteobacteria bacterium]|nr:amino acid ABC transporter permease [Deltaproteobacteria bacterium]
MIDLRIIYNNLPEFFAATTMTIKLAIISSILSLLFGLLVALGRISKKRYLSIPAIAYIEFFRNTPLLIQLYIIFFGLPVLGIRISSFWTGVFGLVLKQGAFFAEAYRAGIESISVTQIEAGKSLGMLDRQIMRIIILPQAIRKIIPPSINLIIINFLATSICYVVSVKELTMFGYILVERSGAVYEIFFALGIFYLAIISLLTLLLKYSEKKLKLLY